MKLEVGKRYVLRNGYITNVMQETGDEKYAFKDGTLSWKASGEYSITGAVSHLDIVSEYIEPQPEPLRWVENCRPDKPGIWAELYNSGNIGVQLWFSCDINESVHAAKATRCYLGPIPEILQPKKKVVERLWLEPIKRTAQNAMEFEEAWFVDGEKMQPPGDWIRTDRTRERKI